MSSWRGCLLVSGVAALLYLNSLPGEFVFDDHEAIENNADVRSDTPLSVLLSHDFWGYPLSSNESHKSFRPLATLSFRWQRQLQGMWAPGFHLANLSLHALVSSLYFLFCLRLLRAYRTATLAAFLFAVHPIHTEAVANVVGRTELLCAVFFLFALLAYQRASPPPLRPKKPSSSSCSSAGGMWWLFLSVIFGLLALLSKEQGITVFGVCVAYEVFITMKLDLVESLKFIVELMQRRSDVGSILRFGASLKCILVMVLSAIVVLIARLYINGGSSPLFTESDNPASFSEDWTTRVLTYAYLCGLNVWLVVFPSRLSFDWSMGSIPLVEGITDSRNGLTLAVFITFFILLFHKRGRSCRVKSGRGSGNGCAATNGVSCSDGTSTTTTINNNNNENNNNNNNNSRRATETCSLSTAAVSFPQPAGFKSTSGLTRVQTARAQDHGSQHHRWVCLSLALLCLPFLPSSNLLFPVGFVVAERVLYLPSMGACLLVAMGMQRLYVFCKQVKGDLILQAAVRYVIVITVATHATKTLMRNFDWWNTQALAESALPVNPGNAKVFVTVGNVYAQQGLRKCEYFYREAIRLRPNYTNAWTNLGLVLLNTERPEEAELCYRRALTFNPTHINANTNMGHLCRLQDRWAESAVHYRTALSRNPDSPTLFYNLGVVLSRMDHPDNITESEKMLRRCIKQLPSHVDAIFSLARLLSNTTSSGVQVQYGYSSGYRLEESIRLYRAGLRKDVQNSNARYELGKLLLLKRELKEAEKELLLVVEAAPNFAKAHRELGNVLKLLQKDERAKHHFKRAQMIENS